jgi:hypothetical protein
MIQNAEVIRLEELRKEIDGATLQLNNVDLTEAKNVRHEKVAQNAQSRVEIKEERHIRMEAGNSMYNLHPQRYMLHINCKISA